LQRGSFPIRKKELATIVGAPSTLLRFAQMRREKTRMTRARGTTRKIKNHITREETIVERLTLVMNGTPGMKTLVMRKGRRLLP
jgi:hypothetical protein